MIKGNNPFERQRIIQEQQQIEDTINRQRLGGMPQPPQGHHHQPLFPQAARIGAVNEWQNQQVGQIIPIQENIKPRQRDIRGDMQVVQGMHQMQHVPLFQQPAQALPRPPQNTVVATAPAVPRMPGPVQPPLGYQAHAFVPNLGYNLNARPNWLAGRSPATTEATVRPGGAINIVGNRNPLPQVHIQQQYLGQPNPFMLPNAHTNAPLARLPPAQQQHPPNGIGRPYQATVNRPALQSQDENYPGFSDTQKQICRLCSNSSFEKIALFPSRKVDNEDPKQFLFKMAQGHFLDMKNKAMKKGVRFDFREIRMVEYIVNKELDKKFNAKKKEFEQLGLPHEEVYAFHGTDSRNIDSILRNNLDPNRVATNGRAHGHGCYFSEFPDVSFRYGNGLILFRTLPGHEYVGKLLQIPKEYQSKKVICGFGDTNYGDMLIIQNPDQFMPYFVYHLQ